jgi:acyl transferase domain-containing protein/acyl carrier protein
LLTTRSVFDHRAVLIGDEVIQGVAQESAPVFIFPGQGSQWHGMAVELLDEDETFAQSMAECDEAIGKLVDWSVRDVLRGEAELLERIEILQPTLFAVMVSLAQTWRKNGVEPAAVVGHSQGEIAAAFIAGALSLDEAARIVVLRSQLFADELVGNGAVASVALPVEEARQLIERWPALSIAGINSPNACTVAGALPELNEFVELCQAREIRARVVASTVASHGPQVEPLREKLMAMLGTITPRSTDIAFYSTVKADRIDTATLDAGYWYENARRPIEFVAITRKLIEDGYRVFVESSPHPVLTMSAQATADADGAELVTVGSLRRGQGGKARFTTSLAEAWVAGLDVRWSYPGGRKIDLPTYPFNRSRFWPKAAARTSNAEDSAFWQLVENGDLTDALGVDAENILPALREWRAKQQRKSTVDGWRYRDSWQLLRGVQATGINGTWLAAVPEQTDEWHEAVLRAFGNDLVRVTVTKNAERALLATELTGIEPVGVISLLGTENTPHEEFTSTPLGLALNVLLLQALGDAGSTAPFWAVTKQAISTGATDHVANPGQVALWGLGRVAALDLPRRWGGLVDLPETIDGQIEQGLVAAITNGGGEDQLAVRDTGVHGRRLVPAQRAPKPTEWTPRGTVLITGGTGALGGHVARWVAGRGAEHVLLTSRRGERAPGAQELRQELEALGARVTIAACDVSDRDSLKAVIDSVPDLKAVVHAAGIVEGNAPTDTLGIDQLDRLLKAKMTSAWLLHELTSDLDAFILFSSGAASWGSGAQPAYAASNAYLDGLAHFRRAQGLKATSIAWGAWADSGMASENEEGAEQLRRRGVHTMKPDLAITALQQAVEDGHTSLTITNMDWEKFAPSFTAARPSPLLMGIPSVQKALEEPETTDSGLKERLLALPEADRTRTLLDLVRTEAAATLGFDSAEAFGPSRAFRDVGFDSVTAVDLRNRLKAVTGVALPATLVFDYPTPAALAQFIRTELLGEVTTANDPEAHIRETLASIPVSRLRQAGLLDLVLQLAQDSGENNSAGDVVLAAEAESIDDMDGEALLRLAIGDAMN